jgi:hypothetical protein
VKLLLGPLHETPPFVKTGVTVIVAIAGVVPVLIALNDAIFPEPFAASPIDVLSLVQLYTVAKPVNVTAAVEAPLHTTWLAG